MPRPHTPACSLSVAVITDEGAQQLPETLSLHDSGSNSVTGRSDNFSAST
jgi:hypothetical protein